MGYEGLASTLLVLKAIDTFLFTPYAPNNFYASLNLQYASENFYCVPDNNRRFDNLDVLYMSDLTAIKSSNILL